MGNSTNTSKRAGKILADEIPRFNAPVKDTAAQDALDTLLGGGVTKPTPVAFPWTIFTVSSTEDDDKPGIYCLAVFDMPKDSAALKLKYSYVKADGTYGRVRHTEDWPLDDDERAAGRVEMHFGPLRPNSRVDIVRAVAVKRKAKDVANPGFGADDRRGKGEPPAYTPPAIPGAWPAAPYANQIPGDGLGPLTMGTVLTGDYITGSPRIVAVGSPKKEVDGIYFPVTVGSTANDDLLISVRFGVYRVGTKAGGTNTYSKRIQLPRYEFNEEELDTLRTAGRVVVDVGPLKAKKRYHIRWIRGRYSLNPDDTHAKVERHRWPVATVVAGVDTTLNYVPSAVSPIYSVDDTGANISVPGNDGGSPGPVATGPQLAILAPTGDIIGPPSDPGSGDLISNAPDIDTEKDKDAKIIFRVWASASDHAKTFADMNVTSMVLVLQNTSTTNLHHIEFPIEDVTAVSQNLQIHRQIGRSLDWVRNVSKNEVDRYASTGSAYAFTAGATGDHTKVTGFTIVIANDGDDNRQADATVTFTNDATAPAVPKRIVILRSKSSSNTSAPATLAEINNGNSNWKPVYKKNLKGDSDSLATAGAKTLAYTIPGVTSAAGVRYYRAFMFVVGDSVWVTDDVSNTGGAESGIPPDTTAPVIVGTPTGRYRKNILRFRIAPLTSQIHTFQYYEWQISNDPAFGGASNYLQDSDTTPVLVGSSATIKTSKNHLEIPINRTDLFQMVPASGSTARRPVLSIKVRATNDIGTGSYSSVGTLTIGRADSDTNIHGAIGRGNMLDGGGFMSSRQNAVATDPNNQPFKVWKYKVTAGMSGAAFRIETTTGGTNAAGTSGAGTSAGKWDVANHQIDIGYRGGGATLVDAALYGKVRRQFIAGEVYTLTFDLKSATAAFDPGTLVVAVTGEAGVSVASQSVTFAGASDSTSPALGTTYRPYKVKFTLASTPTTSAWVAFVFNNAAWTIGQHVYIDNICLVRGNQTMLFEASAADVGIDENAAVTTFANGTELIGDTGGAGDDGISTWGYLDV